MSRETSAAKRFAAGTGDTHARSGPPGRAEEGIVAPERIVDEARESAYRFLEGKRVYRITTRGNLVYDHDVTPEQPALWQRLLSALRRLLGL